MSKLSKVSRRRPTEDEVTGVFVELISDNDRAAALMGGSLLDNVLEGTLNFRFGHLNENERESLFRGTGPLATFSAKIKVAYAMGVIGPNLRDDLDTLRDIRNAFAHSIAPLKFTDQAVSAAVDRLHGLKDNPTHDGTPKSKCAAVIKNILHVLAGKMHNPPLRIEGIDHLS